MIKASHLHYTIGGKTLLRDVNVQFEKGRISLIIGANGAGKSTLLKLLSRQLIPGSGELLFGNEPLSTFSNMQLARIRAVLSQHIDLGFPLRVNEVVMMGRYPHFTGTPTARDHQACAEALAAFDLTGFAERNYLTLSGGEQQRVHFARVMAQTWYPQEGYDRYLILDEPLTFLDIRHQYQFMHKLTQLAREERVIVGVVHDLNLAARFADHMVLLKQGEVVVQGPPKQVLTPAHIEFAFGIQATIMEQDGYINVLFNGMGEANSDTL